MLVYLIDRPMNSIYFLAQLQISFYNHNSYFGFIGDHLPTFIHTFSFCLITVGILGCQKSGYLIIAIGWFLFNTLFELLQKYDTAIVILIPNWFETIPVLENTKNYFINGTFDIFDVLSIAIGAILAVLVLLAIDRWVTNSQEVIKK
jgi:hypothetical protein